MSLFPDIASQQILFMRLFLHVQGGWETVNSFWKGHGIDDGRSVAYSGYMRNKIQHTASVHWRRSHTSCCDVRIAFEARSPSRLFKRTPKKGHRLKRADFKSFIELLQKEKLPGGIIPRFGLPWPSDMSRILGSPRIKTTSLSFEVSGGDDATLHVDLFEQEGGWIGVFEPLTLLELPDGPVASGFFDSSLRLAKAFSQPLLTTEHTDG